MAWTGEAEMNGNEIDMRMFAQRAGANVTFSAGSVVFNKGDPGSCMYIVQSGVIGAAHPRHESGDVRIGAKGVAGSFRQKRIAHRPCVPCAARRAKGAHVLLADAQKRADLAPDAAVDLASGRRAHEDEMFHDRSRAGVRHTIMSGA
jgi:hypothetical protein